MNSDPLDRLEAAHEGLIAALDGDDIAAIEKGIEMLRCAVESVRAEGVWRQSDRLEERARRIVRLGEAARVRVNFLTDLTRQRLEILAAVRGETTGGVYRPMSRSVA